MQLIIELGTVFSEALLPVVLYGVIGYVAEGYLDFDRASFSRLTVYVLLPPLLFSTLLTVQVSGSDILRVAAFTSLVLLGMGCAALAYARMLKMDGVTASGALLAATFFNSVNLGFPVAMFAFGDEGLRLAGVLVAVNAIPHNGFGLFIAARGTLTTRQSWMAIVRMPFLYVLVAALLFRISGLTLPASVFDPIQTLGRAGIPIVLVCIGMELRRIPLGRLDLRILGVVALRLIVAPVVAWMVAGLVGLEGLLKSVVVLQASMPSAVMPIMYARVFGGNVEFVSRAVFLSTVGSVFTLPIVLLAVR